MTTAETLALVQGASSTCSKLKDLEIRRYEDTSGYYYPWRDLWTMLQAGMQTLARAS